MAAGDAMLATAHWSRQGLGDRPAISVKTHPDRLPIDTKTSAPLANGQRLAAMAQVPRCSGVSRLFHPRYPTDIARSVIPIIVDAANGVMTSRCGSDIPEKRCERALPATADLDPAAAVAPKRRTEGGIPASSDHAPPRKILLGLASAPPVSVRHLADWVQRPHAVLSQNPADMCMRDAHAPTDLFGRDALAVEDRDGGVLPQRQLSQWSHDVSLSQKARLR